MFNLTKKYWFIPYLMILPAFVLILIFKISPIISTMLEGIIIDSKFTLHTYLALFKDPVFWNALWVTIEINIVMIPLQVLLAFLIAMLANSTIKGIGIFRTIFYLPVTISLTVATILWNMMFNPNNGIINSLLSILGIPAQGFLISKSQALWCIVIIATWKGVGYWMMFILAGLKNIDTSIYESARIDGAGWIKTTTRITLPLIKRVLLFVFIANTTANVLLFVPMQMITNGGPENSTNVLMFEAYKSAFKFIDRPRSSAIVTVLLLVIVLICCLQSLILSDRDDDAKGGSKKRRKTA